MSRRMNLIISLLSLVAFFTLWPMGVGVLAQSPTKTPLPDVPPTKAPLQSEPPTKTPLPTEAAAPPTKTPWPTTNASDAPTVTTRPTTGPTPDTAAVVLTTPAPTSTARPVTSTALPPTITPIVAGLSTDAGPTPGGFLPTAPVNASSAAVPTPDPAAPLITQAVAIGGTVLGLAVLGLFIWFGLSRLGRSITNEIRTVSLATLRLQHEAERLDRREKVAFRADSDVLVLLEQAILDATGESVHLRLLPNGWLSSPPLLVVVDETRARYLFSPLPPEQVRPLARPNRLAQSLLGEATDLTAYPIDAVTSTPFIADDLTDAFGSVLARHQTRRRPLPRTDRWYLYVARPKTSRWSRWLTRYATQRNRLKRLIERLPFKTRSGSNPKHPTRTGD